MNMNFSVLKFFVSSLVIVSVTNNVRALTTEEGRSLKSAFNALLEQLHTIMPNAETQPVVMQKYIQYTMMPVTSLETYEKFQSVSGGLLTEYTAAIGDSKLQEEAEFVLNTIRNFCTLINTDTILSEKFQYANSPLRPQLFSLFETAVDDELEEEQREQKFVGLCPVSADAE